MVIGIRNMDAQELLTSSYEKNTKLLFKSFLILIEDLHKDHSINFHKLRKALPSDLHALIPITIIQIKKIFSIKSV